MSAIIRLARVGTIDRIEGQFVVVGQRWALRAFRDDTDTLVVKIGCREATVKMWRGGYGDRAIQTYVEPGHRQLAKRKLVKTMLFIERGFRPRFGESKPTVRAPQMHRV